MYCTSFIALHIHLNMCEFTLSSVVASIAKHANSKCKAQTRHHGLSLNLRPNSIFCAAMSACIDAFQRKTESDKWVWWERNVDRKRVPNNLWPRLVITPQRCIHVCAVETVRKLWLMWRCSVLNWHAWSGSVKKRERATHTQGILSSPLVDPTRAMYS